MIIISYPFLLKFHCYISRRFLIISSFFFISPSSYTSRPYIWFHSSILFCGPVVSYFAAIFIGSARLLAVCRSYDIWKEIKRNAIEIYPWAILDLINSVYIVGALPSWLSLSLSGEWREFRFEAADGKTAGRCGEESEGEEGKQKEGKEGEKSLGESEAFRWPVLSWILITYFPKGARGQCSSPGDKPGSRIPIFKTGFHYLDDCRKTILCPSFTSYLTLPE